MRKTYALLYVLWCIEVFKIEMMTRYLSDLIVEFDFHLTSNWTYNYIETNVDTKFDYELTRNI